MVCTWPPRILRSTIHTGAVTPFKILRASGSDHVPLSPFDSTLFSTPKNPCFCAEKPALLAFNLLANSCALYPGANVNQTESNNNRTDWPLTGGSLLLNVHHPWAFTYVNLGLGGDNTTVFNISLVEGFNQTGNGTFCLPTVAIPESLGLTQGTNASIQVIQIGETGSALYNVSGQTISVQDHHIQLWVSHERDEMS